MKFLVIGCGSIGERHIKNLKTFSTLEVIGCDVSKEKLQVMGKKYGIKTFNDCEQALSAGITAALICTPTSEHIPVALLAANRGCHLFIEKPLSHTLKEVDELLQIVSQKKLVALVGCNMRFYRPLTLIKDLIKDGAIGKVLSAKASCGFYLPYWHLQEDYRKSYTANSHMGGGIILDDIHELDYMQWLLGEVKEIFCFSQKISALEMDTEDIAAIIMKFESNILAEVHMDCLQHIYRRSCEFIGEKGLIIGDFIENTIKLFTKEKKQWQNFSDSSDANEMFIDEMKHFINCIEGRDKPQVDLFTAKKVLKIALAAKESSRTGKIIKLA